MKSQFLLDPEITYLNHGSFGACPKPIFEDYQKWQLELERQPTGFITKKLPEYLKASKAALASYINCNTDDFFFVPNPTFAINVIMRSIGLKPGDEILATNHEYGAMDRTWNFYCKQSGAKYVRQEISLPVISKDRIIEEFWKGYNENTKVVFLNQISSATALIFPVMEICKKAQELGLIVIVDGAHVPGHIPLDISEIDADYYTGTLHKWMLTPKGSSFLWVKEEFQDRLDPLVVSWGYESDFPKSQFLDYHEFNGTRDMSAFLTAPAAIRFLEENDWEAKSAECKKMILDNYQRFCDLLGTHPICPITSEFLGQMCSIPVNTTKHFELKETLIEKYKIEIPVMKLNGNVYLRISLNAYNSQNDLDRLYSVLQQIKAETDLIN
ncbi:MAG: aminotransferase class V-fold PLP-dependent enzyme [Flavobacterium sp.]|nr:MAG: aminotransferase class V-fold PLP-dependent enzyme [Flavobacterium sp.]